jgi:hypothetical protein
MRTINLYTFHKGIAPYRFDAHNTQNLIKLLSLNYNVNWVDNVGAETTKFNDVTINQGSIVIFEFDDTKEFMTYDFGDSPTITVRLSKFDEFVGAAIGQYNSNLWDQVLTSPKREKVVPSVYPETCWNFGVENYQAISEFRQSVDLNKNLYWRGSIYKDPNKVEYDRRIAIEMINSKLSSFYFGHSPVPFDSYIQEAIQFKLALCFGVGGGYSCGDFCFRDIEFYGIGIPTLRPKYAVSCHNELVPNKHYISVDCEFDETFRYLNTDDLSNRLIERYYDYK